MRFKRKPTQIIQLSLYYYTVLLTNNSCYRSVLSLRSLRSVALSQRELEMGIVDHPVTYAPDNLELTW